VPIIARLTQRDRRQRAGRHGAFYPIGVCGAANLASLFGPRSFRSPFERNAIGRTPDNLRHHKSKCPRAATCRRPPNVGRSCPWLNNEIQRGPSEASRLRQNNASCCLTKCSLACRFDLTQSVRYPTEPCGFGVLLRQTQCGSGNPQNFNDRARLCATDAVYAFSFFNAASMIA
jgi:hypothetical protein